MNGYLKCPKCGSTKIQVIGQSSRPGIDLGRSALKFITGNGFVVTKKVITNHYHCTECGYAFK